MKTIKYEVSNEITIKKSKFICNIYKITNEEEAKELIKKIEKKYFDAKHNCYAYIVEEKNQRIEKSSDNGEPSGTAGAPMLDVLRKKEISNVLVIVTRYFGGILLGTGGLVKAYTESAISALEKTEIVEKEWGKIAIVEIGYNELKDFTHQCELLKIKCEPVNYGENIKINVEGSEESIKKLVESYKNIKTIKIPEEFTLIEKQK